MNPMLRQHLRSQLEGKTTEELLQMWMGNDRRAWADEAFDAVKELLEERAVEIPAQTKKDEEATPPITRKHEGKRLLGNIIAGVGVMLTFIGDAQLTPNPFSVGWLAFLFLSVYSMFGTVVGFVGFIFILIGVVVRTTAESVDVPKSVSIPNGRRTPFCGVCDSSFSSATEALQHICTKHGMRESEAKENIQWKADASERCPFCAEGIGTDATVCKNCGKDLGNVTKTNKNTPTEPLHKSPVGSPDTIKVIYYFVTKTKDAGFIGRLNSKEITERFQAGELLGDYVAIKSEDPFTSYRQLLKSGTVQWVTVDDLVNSLQMQGNLLSETLTEPVHKLPFGSTDARGIATTNEDAVTGEKEEKVERVLQRAIQIFSCDLCDSSFASLVNTFQHIRKTHKISRAEIEKHIQREVCGVEGSTVFSCDLCNRSFVSLVDTFQHIHSDHKISRTEAEEHIRREAGDFKYSGVFSCDLCDSSFPSPIDAFQHVCNGHGMREAEAKKHLRGKKVSQSAEA